VAWAAILAYTTWPVHKRLRAALRESRTGAALVMTGLLVLAVAGPVILLSVALVEEAAGVIRAVKAAAAQLPEVPGWARGIPWIGERLVSWRGELLSDPQWWQGMLSQNANWLTTLILGLVGDVGRNLMQLLLTLFTVAFLYFHGETLARQTATVVHRLAGERVVSLIHIAGDTVRAVWYGMLLTATAQGLLAGLGFWAVGLPAPILLGAATALLALLPLGPPLLWVPAGLWLLFQGSVWKGIGLLVWGALGISGIDNVLRPLLIGGATRIPYLLVFFGVLGGLGAFGLLGLFLGPTILSVLLVLWREWAQEALAPDTKD
jgi:predicted PurR-regulated permease PerM